MSEKMDKKILCISRKDWIVNCRFFHGVCGSTVHFMLHMSDHLQFLRRGDIENDPNYKQIIPYVATFCTVGPERYLRYVRSTKGGEVRLHNKASIGIGGHIEEGDCGDANNLQTIVRTAALREFDEELKIDGSYKFGLSIRGLINDESDDVGRVHLGVLMQVAIDNSRVTAGDEEANEVEFMTPFQLYSSLSDSNYEYENWSRLAIQFLKHDYHGDSLMPLPRIGPILA